MWNNKKHKWYTHIIKLQANKWNLTPNNVNQSKERTFNENKVTWVSGTLTLIFCQRGQ